MVSMLIEIYVYPVRYEIHIHMYVLPVLLDPVSALDQFKDGPVLVLEFPENFRTRPNQTLKHYMYGYKPRPLPL